MIYVYIGVSVPFQLWCRRSLEKYSQKQFGLLPGKCCLKLNIAVWHHWAHGTSCLQDMHSFQTELHQKILSKRIFIPELSRNSHVPHLAQTWRKGMPSSKQHCSSVLRLPKSACSLLASCFKFCITFLEFKTRCFDSSRWIYLERLLHSKQAAKHIPRPEVVLCSWGDKPCPQLAPSASYPPLDGQPISIWVAEPMLLALGIWP